MKLAMVGLGRMGMNMARRLLRGGHEVVAFNRSPDKTERLAAEGADGAYSLPQVVEKLAPPRVVWLMLPAGEIIDEHLEQLRTLLEAGDIVIDGANTYYRDDLRRSEWLAERGLHFLDAGVSGGIWGLKLGYCLMIGGEKPVYEQLVTVFETLAPPEGYLYCGPAGAGHFVKMVHNGIEYGDMQLICEAYQIMKDLLGLSYPEMHQVFADWNEGDLKSYLIEITRDILAYKDEDGQPLVEKILDTAGQKGTGKWTVVASLDAGAPLTMIGEAVYARMLSAMKDERVAASKVLKGPQPEFKGDKQQFIADLGQALYAAKIVSYAQGYVLMRMAAKDFGWHLNYGGIALMWRGGCIIRSVFLGKIKEAFDQNPSLSNLLLDPFFKEKIESSQNAWRRVIATAVTNGIWVPALASALNYFDGFRNSRLPANLLQAQRDYFGAHTYERIDKPRGEFFHTNWTGRGGETSSTTYTV